MHRVKFGRDFMLMTERRHCNMPKKAVTGIVQGGETRGTVADIRKAFDKRTQVDDITVLTGQDLEITKEGNDVVVSFAYPQKITLFGNVSLLIDFAGASNR